VICRDLPQFGMRFITREDPSFHELVAGMGALMDLAPLEAL